MGEEIAPQAVYIAHPAGSSAWRDSTGLGRLMDTYAWHVIATRDQRTLCGIDASGGSQRRAWKDTPAGHRCRWCTNSCTTLPAATSIETRQPERA